MSSAPSSSHQSTLTIRDVRLALGMSQSELAEICGRHQGSISQWELGLCSPPPEVASRLVDLLRARKPDAVPPDIVITRAEKKARRTLSEIRAHHDDRLRAAQEIKQLCAHYSLDVSEVSRELFGDRRSLYYRLSLGVEPREVSRVRRALERRHQRVLALTDAASATGRIVLEARELAGMPRSTLAAHLGISHELLRRMEVLDLMVSFERWQKIREALRDLDLRRRLRKAGSEAAMPS